MPGGNKTGPHGKGPLTGRQLGLCAGNDIPGFNAISSSLGYGQGGRFGRRYGFRYGQRHFMDETLQYVSKETLLENEARVLKEQLASIEKQLSDIKKKDA